MSLHSLSAPVGIATSRFGRVGLSVGLLDLNGSVKSNRGLIHLVKWLDACRRFQESPQTNRTRAA